MSSISTRSSNSSTYYPAAPYNRADFRTRVEQDQQKLRFAKRSDRYWSAGALGATTLTTAGSAIFVVYSVGLTGFLVGSVLFLLASCTGLAKAVHKGNEMLWRRHKPAPSSLRLHSFSSTGVVPKGPQSASLTHWLQAQEIVGKARNRIVLQKARVNDLETRRVRQSFPELTDAQLLQIEDTLDVVATIQSREAATV